MRFFLSTHNKNVWKKIWQWLTAATSAVVLITLTAAVAILGTVIPQKEATATYLKLYGEVFAGLFNSLGLFDLYASLPFQILLTLLGLSLFACSYKRWFSAVRGKRNYYLWGSFIAHISILLIYLGAIYGSTAGFSANARIEKGKDFFEPRGNFSVRLNDFNAKFDERGRPLYYSSDLSVVEDGKEVLRKIISVNDPLSYKGVKFYQSSYGLNGALEIAAAGGKLESIPITRGSCAIYAATGQMFCVEELFHNLHQLHGQASAAFEPTAPVAYVIAHDNNNSQEIGWLVQGETKSWGNYSLKLTDVVEYTGLQVKKDPGLLIVYLGFLFLTIGVGIMLYVKR